MTQRRSKSETEIPHFLIPHVIARQIKERGDDLFRISVKRTHWHHYTVTVRTKPQYRELRVRKNAGTLRENMPLNDPGTKPGNDNSEGVA